MKNPDDKSVGLDFHYLSNLNKGFGQYCLHLAKNFPSLPIEDLKLTYYLPYQWKNRFGKQINYKTALSLHKYLKISNDVDLWHSTTHLSKITLRKGDAKILYTIHDAIFSLFDRPNEATKEHYKNLQSKINHSSGLVYISEFTKKNINEKFTIPPHVRQYVIYNGTPEISNLSENVKKPAFPYLLCVGEFRGYKNQKALIPMLEFLDKDIKLVFVGKCSKKQMEKIQPLIKKHDVQNRIIFEGSVSGNKKANLLTHASALVHPSLAEGFGLPVVEAMSLGVPVIISNKTSLPEVGGTAAAYWDHYDPEYMAGIVNKTLDDYKNNKTHKVSELKKQASLFSWERAAKEYLQVYRELLE